MKNPQVSSERNLELEWRINVGDGTSKVVAPRSSRMSSLKDLVVGIIMKAVTFVRNAWELGAAEPRKVVHCIKVGLAVSVVSLSYYMRPLYDGVGGNAMWAVMTVVVVFEYTVGATLSKSINRATGTFLAGSLGVGVHWVASHSGQLKPVVLGISLFLLASAATFSRFIPSVKRRFDYGAMIFVLTFSLVSVSGYRVEKLFELATQRLTTIAIGTSLCILTSMLVYPVWAGVELHDLLLRNLENLAASLDGCIDEYFKEEDQKDDETWKQMQAFKGVLNSKATEESMANFARWEPAHGRFSFRHPWTEYLKIGGLIRTCAYCIETLNAYINSDIQAPKHLKRQLKDECLRVSSQCGETLEEVALTMRTMTRSSKVDLSVAEMGFAVRQLRNSLTNLPNYIVVANPNTTPTVDPPVPPPPPLLEVLPLVTLVSLLIEIAARIESIVDGVAELANLADFRHPTHQKSTNTADNESVGCTTA